jgi:MFS family permease
MLVPVRVGPPVSGWIPHHAETVRLDRGGHELSAVRRLRNDPIFIVVHALVMLASLAQYALFPLLPQIEQTMGISSLGLAILVAVPTVLMIGAAIPVGRLCDRWGGRRVTVAGAGLLACSCCLQATSSIWPFTAGRVLFGLALTAIWTAGPAWLHASRPGSTARVGTVVTSAAAGTIAGPALAGLVADRLGLGWPFVLVGAASGILALGVAWARGGRNRRRSPRAIPPRCSAATLLGDPASAAAMSAMAAVGVASGAIQLLVPLQLGREGQPASAIGGVMCAAGVVYVVFSGMVTRTGEAIVTPQAVAFGCILMGLLTLPAAWRPDSGSMVLAALLLFTVPRALLNTVGYRLASQSTVATAGNIGVVIGSLNLVWSIAMSVGPIGAGWLDDQLGARAAFFGTALASIGMGLSLAVLKQSRRAARPQPAQVRGHEAFVGPRARAVRAASGRDRAEHAELASGSDYGK